MKRAETWKGEIYCGLMAGYDGREHSFSEAIDIVQQFCNDEPWGVTVTPTNYVYRDGREPGIIVGLIQYPRFVVSIVDLEDKVMRLARILLEKLEQERLTVVFPRVSVMLEKEDL